MLYQIIGADPTKVYSDDLPATYDNTALAKFKKPAMCIAGFFYSLYTRLTLMLPTLQGYK
jgi:hypothetical protein